MRRITQIGFRLAILTFILQSLLLPYPGWHVGDDSPVTVSTAYRWVTTAVQARYPAWKESESYALFPVDIQPSIVMTYSVHKSGASLSRECQDAIVPGDYGLYATGVNTTSSIATG